jgi:hypothetical protein
MKRLAQHLATAYDMMEQSGYVLPDPQAFEHEVTAVLLEYNYLAKHAMGRVPYVPRWSVIPKHHYLAHLAQQAYVINPRMLWTYGGEDFVGKVSDLGHHCLRGNASFRVGSALAERYKLAMHIRFAKRL